MTELSRQLRNSEFATETSELPEVEEFSVDASLHLVSLYLQTFCFFALKTMRTLTLKQTVLFSKPYSSES